MTYYVIKFVWENSYNSVQTTYAGYDKVGHNCHNWWPSPYRDFNEAEKFDDVKSAKNFYEKHGNFFNAVSVKKNSTAYISKIVFNIKDVEKI